MKDKDKFYKSFSREQLIERCEYLQRSCERKENTITDREIENVDLEKEIERLNNEIKTLLQENGNKEKVITAQDNIIKEVREYITTIKEEDIQYTIGWVKQDILEILDKVGSEDNE